MSIGLLILRIALGGIFFAHGAQKLFGWFQGHGPSGTAEMLASQGFRPPRAHAYLAGLAEAGGGLLLAMGLLTPLGAAAIIGVMVNAIVVVHLANGFFNQDGGIEFPVFLATSALALAFTGAGRYALDRAIGWDVGGWEWGLGALALGVVVATFVMASRPEPAEQRALPAATDRDQTRAA